MQNTRATGRPNRSTWAWLAAAPVVAMVALAAWAAFGPAAHAQQFPSRPVRIVVPFPPGGTVDVAMRVVSVRLGEVLGQSVVIDNKPGANGIIGGDLVAKAPPDGHTLFAVSSTHVINPATTARCRSTR